MGKSFPKSVKTDLTVVTLAYSLLDFDEFEEYEGYEIEIHKEIRDMLEELDADIKRECLAVMQNRNLFPLKRYVLSTIERSKEEIWNLLDGKTVNYTILAYFILYYNFNSDESAIEPWERRYKVDPLFEEVKRIYSMDVVLDTFTKYGLTLKDRMVMAKLAKDIIKVLNPTRKYNRRKS